MCLTMHPPATTMAVVSLCRDSLEVLRRSAGLPRCSVTCAIRAAWLCVLNENGHGRSTVRGVYNIYIYIYLLNGGKGFFFFSFPFSLSLCYVLVISFSVFIFPCLALPCLALPCFCTNENINLQDTRAVQAYQGCLLAGMDLWIYVCMYVGISVLKYSSGT